jgi:hypothetical protein
MEREELRSMVVGIVVVACQGEGRYSAVAAEGDPVMIGVPHKKRTVQRGAKSRAQALCHIDSAK